MTSLLLLFILLAAVAVVVMPSGGSGKNSRKARVEPEGTGGVKRPEGAGKRVKGPALKFSFSLQNKNLARELVGGLQGLLGAAILACAAIFYQYSAELAREGYDASVGNFVVLSLGVMALGALATLACGYYTFWGRPRMVRLFAVVEVLFAVVFLLPGTVLWPVSASLVVMALCSVIAVGKVTPVYRPVFKSNRFVKPGSEAVEEVRLKEVKES